MPLQPSDGLLHPAQNRTVMQNGVAEAPPVVAPPTVEPVVQDASTVNWDNILYVVFDLETTGWSPQHNKIIKISAQFLDPDGIQLEDGIFDQLVKPNSPIPSFIAATTIMHDDVRSVDRFPAVGDAFIRFMWWHADAFSAEHDQIFDHIVHVAHNGKVFDIPFFIKSTMNPLQNEHIQV